MIVYLDTSAFVPLLIAEAGSAAARQLWDGADQVVVTRLVHVETSAALAAAERAGRLDAGQARQAVSLLEQLWRQVDVIEVDETLMRRASHRARQAKLRGYDAVHCAAAESIHHFDVVAASADTALLGAWSRLGLATANVLSG